LERSHVLEFISLILFLGAFAKLSKFIISLVISVCLSVRPHGTTCSHRLDFREIRYSFFSKHCRENSNFINVWGKNWQCTWKATYVYDISLNSSQNKKCFRKFCSGNWSTQFMSNYFFPKIVPFMRYY